MKSPDSIKLIVGLGNPGAEHQDDRHNAGFWLCEQLAQRFSAAGLSEDGKFHGRVAQLSIAGRNLRLLLPGTYMNRSGLAVASLLNFYKLDAEEMLVVHDELDLAPGVARLKFGGGPGGHNGLKDIISSIGNNRNFGRLRIGIGHPGSAAKVSGYVLKKAPAKEQQYIDEAIDESIKHIEAIVAGDWQSVMNSLHGFDAAPDATQEKTQEQQ